MTRLLSTIIILALLCGAAVAQQVDRPAAAEPEQLPKADRALAEKTLDQLSHFAGLWLEAHERQDKSAEIHLEKELLRVMRTDIFKSQNILLHHQKTLKDSHDRGYGDTPYAAEDDAALLSLELLARLRSMISAKEAIATSVLRSKSFAHKFRLITDYQYLLRSQLGMPKLRLATQDDTAVSRRPDAP